MDRRDASLSRRSLRPEPDYPLWRQEVGETDRAVGSGDSGSSLPPARVYSPGELSKVLDTPGFASENPADHAEHEI